MRRRMIDGGVDTLSEYIFYARIVNSIHVLSGTRHGMTRR